MQYYTSNFAKRIRGAHYISEIEEIKYKIGDRVMVSTSKYNKENNNKKERHPYIRGVVVNDYERFVLVNHGKKWLNESYLKTDIITNDVRIIMEGRANEVKIAR